MGDPDDKLLRRTTESIPAQAYNDYRSLIVETSRDGLDWLFVALAPFRSLEFVHLAAQHGVGVFHKSPPARNLDEAVKLVNRFDRCGCPLIVSRPWRFEPAFQTLTTIAKRIGWVYAATAELRTTHDGRAGWRGDSERAGGGVLLNDAYAELDMLVNLLGIPQQVGASCGYATTPGAARPYDTEDTSIVSMQFGQGRIAGVCAHRCAYDEHHRLALFGTEGNAQVLPDRLVVTDRGAEAGQTLRVRAKNRFAAELRALADWHFQRAENPERKHPSTGADHLATLAVVQAAYLSARTGSPESPDSFPQYAPHPRSTEPQRESTADRQ